MLDAEQSLETKVDLAIATVRQLIESGELLCVAWSGGKDSTTLLALAVEGWRQASGPKLPLAVVTADTEIENPAVHSYWRSMLETLTDYAAKEGIALEIRVARPSLAKSWVAQVIGGRTAPTFANSKERQCSVDLKRDPSQRELKRLMPDIATRLGTPALARQTPITLVGTRFSESAERDRRMNARGDVAGHVRSDETGARMLPLIADWSTDEVWEFLGRAGWDFPAFAPDFQETVRIYRDAAGECVIVAGDKGNHAACGARHGCALCTVSGSSDKSMETMLAQPQYAFMTGLNRLRDYLVATRYDWSLRRWSGREEKHGQVRITPNIYGPAMVDRLLRYALTLDIREAERAQALDDRLRRREAGGTVTRWGDVHLDTLAAEGRWDEAYAQRMRTRQFQLVDVDKLLLVDFMWSRYGYHPPFHALAIYDEIYNRGHRFDIPTVAAVPATPRPERLPANVPDLATMPGLYDALADFAHESCAVPYGTDLRDGSRIAGIADADAVTVDHDSAFLILDLELPELLRRHADPDAKPWAAAEYYLRMGTITLNAQSAGRNQQMARHSQRLAAAGIGLEDPGEDPEPPPPAPMF